MKKKAEMNSREKIGIETCERENFTAQDEFLSSEMHFCVKNIFREFKFSLREINMSIDELLCCMLLSGNNRKTKYLELSTFILWKNLQNTQNRAIHTFLF
jgi:hypothetical protein